MNYIDYFKSQSKKFYKDFKTQYKKEGESIYSYNPTFWADIEDIIVDFDIDEYNFSLMKTQHIVAYLAGFYSWNELLSASNARLELGYLLVENRWGRLVGNQWGYILEDWKMYLDINLRHLNLDDESELEIFKYTFLHKE
jgi:hypothetical protein